MSGDVPPKQIKSKGKNRIKGIFKNPNTVWNNVEPTSRFLLLSTCMTSRGAKESS